jgi:hypothetical protein
MSDLRGGKIVVEGTEVVGFGLSASKTCSMRAWVGCVMAGYRTLLVWTSYTPFELLRRAALSVPLNWLEILVREKCLLRMLLWREFLPGLSSVL